MHAAVHGSLSVGIPCIVARLVAGLPQAKRSLSEDDGAISFTLRVTARLSASDAEVDFGGAFVHGRPGEGFLYLGYRPVGAKDWVRRWKISLAAIAAQQVREAAGGKALLGRISATSGSTARLLGTGWTVSRAAREDK